MTVEDEFGRETWHTDDSDTLADYRVTLKDIHMDDVSLPGARPISLSLGQSFSYADDFVSPAAHLVRRRDYEERLAAFQSSNSDTVVLLIRSGDKDEGHGRGYFALPRTRLPQLLTRLCRQHGFVVSSVPHGALDDSLPDDLPTDD